MHQWHCCTMHGLTTRSRGRAGECLVLCERRWRRAPQLGSVSLRSYCMWRVVLYLALIAGSNAAVASASIAGISPSGPTSTDSIQLQYSVSLPVGPIRIDSATTSIDRSNIDV